MKRLNEIQQKLSVPKGQTNSFGNYKYRSCEDILEAVKPLLGEATLVISDEIVMLGDRFYVKATATLSDGKESISNTAYARESLVKKGMDESQITGATSSYARKYALNGLLLIDDTKDADTMDNRQKKEDITDKLQTKLSFEAQVEAAQKGELKCLECASPVVVKEGKDGSLKLYCEKDWKHKRFISKAEHQELLKKSLNKTPF